MVHLFSASARGTRGLVLLSLATLAATSFAGCGGDGPGPLPIAEGNPCEGPVTFAVGDEGHTEPLGSRPNEARAGRLPADAVPPDPRGLNTYQAGDFVLANEHVGLIIEDARPSDHFVETGGMLVGTVLDELERRNLRRGLITLCVGAGMGTTTIIERV